MAAQEPGSADEIRQFCTKNYGVTFDLFPGLFPDLTEVFFVVAGPVFGVHDVDECSEIIGLVLQNERHSLGNRNHRGDPSRSLVEHAAGPHCS